MSPWTPPAGWWPLVALLVAAGLVVLVVEHWPEPRTPEQRQVDGLARDARRRERQMLRRGWDR